jgi:SecD/SecF fusion protein
MLKRHLWSILLSALFLGWAISELIPLHNADFGAYVAAHATANKADFDQLLSDATARVKAGQSPSQYVALKAIATERKIDLTQYFPNIQLESSLHNVGRRNEILLNELLHRSKAKLQRGLDLAGGVQVTLEVDPKVAARDTSGSQEKLTKAIEIISARVNGLGVAEPLIRQEGDNRIQVEMAGVDPKTNPDLIDEIRAPALLEFRMVHPTLSPSQVAPGEVPPGYEQLTDDEDRDDQSVPQEYFVKRIPEATGNIIANAYRISNSYGQPWVGMQFTAEGRKAFARMTRDIAASGQRSGRTGYLAIVLDGKLVSVASVKQEIDDDQAEIEGTFTDRRALEIADDLNNPLDVPLVPMEQLVVGPSLAADAVSSGFRASVIGTAAVVGFMLVFYTTGGLVAVFTLAINIIIILGVMASIGTTMTLPGLAGIVLTIGMAVDANILIFERMREEIHEGKSLAIANQSGYRKALTTILDAHFVQLIICTIMIWLGTGPIKGFGITLAIGVLSTMFTVLVTAHLIMVEIIHVGWVKQIKMRHLLKSIHVDFINWGKPAAIASVLLVLVGMGVVVYKGNSIKGIDFSGGDEVTLQYGSQVDVAQIRQVAEANKIGEVDPTYISAVGGGHELLRIETHEGESSRLVAALQQAYPAAHLDQVQVTQIGASVGNEIELNALLAVGVSMLTILIYIAFRFEFGFGIGAMCSTLHDILMTIGIFVITGHQFSAPMVGAILCIAGYSINETVVVFDRIREELKLNPNGSLRDVINSAINKVFARTIMTATTTFLAALALYLFGTGVLKDIAFTFLVGIVTSTFSAIFIASQMFYWWHKGDRKHVEAHADVAPKYDWAGSSKASK